MFEVIKEIESKIEKGIEELVNEINIISKRDGIKYAIYINREDKMTEVAGFLRILLVNPKDMKLFSIIWDDYEYFKNTGIPFLLYLKGRCMVYSPITLSLSIFDKTADINEYFSITKQSAHVVISHDSFEFNFENEMRI